LWGYWQNFCARFQVLTVMIIKITVLQDVTLCSLADVYRPFPYICTTFSIPSLFFYLEDGGNTFLQNVDIYHSNPEN
jgi:hypothetical protein